MNSKKYTNDIIKYTSTYDKPTGDGRLARLPDVVLTETTILRRKQIRQQMDRFCHFSWGGVNAFDTFGAFISGKDALKFYNGPGFSNQYTAPMFTDNGADLLGIKFNTQKISIPIALYWISEEHYRRFISWLHPYEVNNLIFSFQPGWSYKVKLAGIKDSKRTIVGYENYRLERYGRNVALNSTYEENDSSFAQAHTLTTAEEDWNLLTPKNEATAREEEKKKIGKIQENVPMYYTELTLDFEIQGESCLTYNLPYEFFDEAEVIIQELDRDRNIWALDAINSNKDDNPKYVYNTYLNYISEEVPSGNIRSNLDCGFKLSINFNLAFADYVTYPSTNKDNSHANDSLIVDNIDPMANLTFELEACYRPATGDPIKFQLYKVDLQNLSFLYEQDQTKDILFDLSYNSNDGLVFWSYADEESKLLTRLSIVPSGERIVRSLQTRQFRLPGTFDNPDFDFSRFSLCLTISGSMLKYIRSKYLDNWNDTSHATTERGDHKYFFELGTPSDITMHARTNIE